MKSKTKQKIKASQVHFEIKGVNLNRIFSDCKKENIELFNINRKDFKNMEFDVGFHDKNRFQKIAKERNIKFCISSKSGFEKLKNEFFLHFGMVFGIFLFVFLNIFCNLFIWDIKVYGNSRVSTDEILAVLKEHNIEKSKIKNTEKICSIEKILENQIEDISLCSVIVKGTTIVVNIKEKLFVDEMNDIDEGNDIVAPQNLTITELVVVNGTAQKKVGDSVKKGEVIVSGFVLKENGEKVFCKANASIKAKTWHSASQIYKKQKTVATRTGNTSKTSFLSLFGMKFDVKCSKNQFDSFEIETSETMLSNNFLPIKMTTITFFETTLSVIEQNFEKGKEIVLQQTQKLAGGQVKDGEQITNIFDVITENEDEYIITSYVEILIDI